MYQGGCQCSQVRYQFNGKPLTCYACHCTECQTSSGSAFTLSMLLNRKDIEIIQGKVAVNRFDHNGTIIERHHCGNCGTAFWYGSDEHPDIIAFKPGTFDDTKWFKPIAHLWLRSAQPLVTLDASTAQYQKQPEMRELIKLWVKNT